MAKVIRSNAISIQRRSRRKSTMNINILETRSLPSTYYCCRRTFYVEILYTNATHACVFILPSEFNLFIYIYIYSKSKIRYGGLTEPITNWTRTWISFGSAAAKWKRRPQWWKTKDMCIIRSWKTTELMVFESVRPRAHIVQWKEWYANKITHSTHSIAAECMASGGATQLAPRVQFYSDWQSLFIHLFLSLLHRTISFWIHLRTQES